MLLCPKHHRGAGSCLRFILGFQAHLCQGTGCNQRNHSSNPNSNGEGQVLCHTSHILKRSTVRSNVQKGIHYQESQLPFNTAQQVCDTSNSCLFVSIRDKLSHIHIALYLGTKFYPRKLAFQMKPSRLNLNMSPSL